MKFGVIVGNRGFFPGHLCETGRKTILKVLAEAGIDTVILPLEATRYGAVESLADARKCADLFRAHRDEIDGVLVTLPNFGDERGVANTLRWAELGVPVMVHAFSDSAADMTIKNRRDSFCGKMSVCNNLRQYDIPFSLTALHTVDPEEESFKDDLRRFAAVCRVVRGLKGARIAAIGARPAPFNTVRFSEKLLEQSGITVETLDLFELVGWTKGMTDGDAAVKAKLEAVNAYTCTKSISAEGLSKMAKLGVAIDKYMKDNAITATAIQCWTAMEEFYGVVPCTMMSMMSNSLLPSACEVDIQGLVGMMVLQSASGRPSALLDWNNNYGGDPNKGVLFHCSNLPKDFFVEHKMDYQEIIAGAVGKENTYGTIVGRIKPAPFTYCRISTDDTAGVITSYVGEGRFTDDNLTTFGGFGVFEIPNLQGLLRFICENGFEHHVACNLSQVAAAAEEALTKYLGWEVYHHGECCCDCED